MEKTSHNPEQTAEIIASISGRFSGGDVVLLQGELGSGKTTSVKAIAKHFGVTAEITSPTFVIMKNYPLPEVKQGVAEIVHMDAYRLHGAPDAESIGLTEYLERDDVLLLIEWPENIENILPPEAKKIEFSHLSGDIRTIKSNF